MFRFLAEAPTKISECNFPRYETNPETIGKFMFSERPIGRTEGFRGKEKFFCIGQNVYVFTIYHPIIT